MNFEFLNCINWGEDHEVRAVKKIDGIGIIVDAVQHVVVLGGPESVGGECATGGIASSVSLRTVHSGCELCQESKVSAVQRKIVDVLLIDHLANGCILRLQQGRFTGHFNGFRNTARLKFEIARDVGAHINRYVSLAGGFETLPGHIQPVVANTDGAEAI